MSIFFGLRLDHRPLDVVAKTILADMENGHRVRHLSLNAVKLVSARRDPALQDALARCDVLSADGMGIVWAARMLGYRVAERVSGIDLMMALMPGLAQRGLRVFLLGARPQIVARTADILQRDYPGLIIGGYHHGYNGDDDALTKIIRASRADVAFVALPSPRKDIFVCDQADATGCYLMMAVGGAFDVIAGDIRRAPKIWQNCGCEWLWRVLQDPRDKAPRYGMGLTQFAGLIATAMVRRMRLALAAIVLCACFLGFGTAKGQEIAPPDTLRQNLAALPSADNRFARIQAATQIVAGFLQGRDDAGIDAPALIHALETFFRDQYGAGVEDRLIWQDVMMVIEQVWVRVVNAPHLFATALVAALENWIDEAVAYLVELTRGRDGLAADILRYAPALAARLGPGARQVLSAAVPDTSPSPVASAPNRGGFLYNTEPDRVFRRSDHGGMYWNLDLAEARDVIALPDTSRPDASPY
ncbi:WecB/TagA/CpsF family glycosyltransferase [Thalassospira sp.]|uniref:WecB/TagA/CpsF family glycosyltransferase n=1 Tax=Thalassospira sp. TaxID=1912094 RepID=UPI0027350F40|nr:WecB/TagA/CpsF family glycosyltransferase [Thalassospira sp.]MDP2698717.1 WecB/TagA/CpsF family glycosyltransferase [Thalassospira sp.]